MLERVHASWVEVLSPHQNLLQRIELELVRREEIGEVIAPERVRILRALEQPLTDIKVLIVGQDPYPSAGHAVGWSFSVEQDVSPLPKSLQNIFRELADDIGLISPSSGDLSAWVEQGVMLLNRTLSVTVGAAGSHANIGWHSITDALVSAIAARPQPLVSILWGSHAQQLLPLVSARPSVTSAHPSPLSAYRGFFGSKPFSRANELLVSQGSTPINWQL